MKKPLQVILLGIVFIVPLAILVFLNAFGDNRFEVPVFSVESGIFEECADDKAKVSNTILSPGNLHVSIYLDNPEERKVREIQYAYERIENALANPVVFHTVSADSINLTDYRRVSAEQLMKEMHCEFGTDTLGQYILTDSQNRIRGFYGQDLKEVDRLIVEAKIVFENEQRDAKK